jgi:hypothetical protein
VEQAKATFPIRVSSKPIRNRALELDDSLDLGADPAAIFGTNGVWFHIDITLQKYPIAKIPY